MSGKNQLYEIFPISVSNHLDEHAAIIRWLGKKAIHDIIEIGRRLSEAKKIAGHGNWLPWLEKEFGWTEQTALNFMRVHELAKSKNFLDLNLPVSALYLLAAPGTPTEAIDAVIERAEAGEKVSHRDVKAEIKAANIKFRPSNTKLPAEIMTATAKPEPARVEADILTAREMMSVLSAPKISDDLAMRLRGNRATLLGWMHQHNDSGIPAVLAAFDAAIKVIEAHLK